MPKSRHRTKTITPSARQPKLKRSTARYFMWVAMTVFATTSLIWTIFSAQIQQRNADQLADSYLMKSWDVFKQAVLPGAHSFLIKWPVFLIIHWFGTSQIAFQIATVLISLVTVGGLAYVLYRINHHPLMFGLLLLCLASCTLLVPAQSYPGALLPVNMAMLATRNLEYLVYIGCLMLLIRADSKRTINFWLAIVGLTLLVASDKLFLTLSLGGAVIGLTVTLLYHQRKLVRLYIDWLLAGLLAGLLSIGLLMLINHLGIVHISSQASDAPYHLIHSFRQIVIGTIFAITGVITNFGANPAYATTNLHDLPGHLVKGLLSSTGLAYLVNGLIMLWLVYMSVQFLKQYLRRRPPKRATDAPAKLSIMLVWSALTAFLAFIMTDHYYAVDARYLTIVLFALFIVAATQQRKSRGPSRELAYGFWVILMGSIILGIFAVGHTHRAEVAALEDINSRNSYITSVLQSHKVDLLVGDYWRVLPIKDQHLRNQNILPMESCFTPRTNLSSQAWQLNLNDHSFAYLLSLDKSLTDYPSCNLDQIIAQYGRPNATILIAGKLSSPKELILFYDRGAHKSAPVVTRPLPTTVLPIPISELPNTSCSGLQSIVQVVAHQDDDLLFMSPNLFHDVQEGNCVRTIYLTAGDAGGSQAYWLSRERGSQAAYNTMLHNQNGIWIQRTVRLDDGRFTTVDNPRGNPRISLVFFRLPDGNMHGEGFRSSYYESLAQLEAGRIPALHSVDKQSQFNRSQLIASLVTLFDLYRPTIVRTQSPLNIGKQFPDHSDHLAAGWFAHQAFHSYGSGGVPIQDYIGYPSHERPQNVFGADLIEKEDAFINYGQFDSGVCRTIVECENTATYGSYLQRQYTL